MKLFLLALLVCLNTIFRGYSFEDSPTVIIKMSTTTLGLPTILIGGFSVLLDSGSN